ncbi:Regulatory protein-like protein [Hapsidospora chrysogenum ATCC 11550]|uniref:Regulatory protein-like protein n=2 Tax=Hapsidospora chrysogena TaxID=5044 RepID=A0A086T5U2_HAPC1|nr:WetA [Hapsidospora chrysogena]KFH44724.1 Regulatory protein-like protein [Hapsidospora chrysogenum ATCC 11550]
MDFWTTMQYRASAYRTSEAADREHGFFWHDVDAVDDATDFFGQFVDFDGHAAGTSSLTTTSSSSAAADGLSADQAVPRLPEALLLDNPPESISSSTADEFDFLSTSSRVGRTSSVGQDIDPSNLAVNINNHNVNNHHEQLVAGVSAGNHQHQPVFLARGSISDTELPRVEGICLSSPTKDRHPSSVSQPASPTPPNTTTAQRTTTNRFVEAVQSTIRKATNRRKPKKPAPQEEDHHHHHHHHRPASPPAGYEPLKAPRQRPRRGANNNNNSNSNNGVNLSIDISKANPPATQPAFAGNSGNFIHGACEDPFSDVPPLPPHATLRYFHPDVGIGSPLESPAIKSEPGSFHTDHTTSQMPPDAPWEHQQHSSLPGSATVHWAAGGSSEMLAAPPPHTQTADGNNWWEHGMMTAQNGGAEFVDHQENAADFNPASHSQQAQLPYEYQRHQAQHHAQHHAQHQVPDTATSGLMIQIPHHQSAAVHDLTLTAQTHLPPPPPPQPASERPHRPPRAPSSGARHLSCSPTRRKTRAPSASPTRTTSTPSAAKHKRHSSGGSAPLASSATRSASGRLPTSMPGTPCSVRKRRSREPSGGGAAAAGAEMGGFVNFTPDDGGMLMTGVAPSGSSKTKARREKEALDRRRKLSEAAIKAVAAAGGDVETLMQQGFTF